MNNRKAGATFMYRQIKFFMAATALATLGFFTSLDATAQGNEDLAEFVKATYTKYEHYIPMRDGVRLFTAVYVPKDDSKDYGMMMKRTPYSVSPYGVDHYRSSLGPSENFAREGFIFVYQDVRGQFMSEGEFVDVRPHNPNKKGDQDIDESSDTYDTVDWLVKNVPNNNGRVGQWGISYPGFFTVAGMIDAHPALKASSPQAPVTDLYRGDDAFHNGVFNLAHNFGFLTNFVKRKELGPPKPSVRFDFGTPDGYEFYLNMGPLVEGGTKYLRDEAPLWDAFVEHTTYDEFWQARSIDLHLNNVPKAVMTVGGWYDAEDLAGPFKIYESVEERNHRVANHLVLGPWVHGGWARGDGDRLGSVRFNAKTSEFYRDEIEFPFFNRHVNKSDDEELPKVWAFQTGTNQWRRHDAWPPESAKTKSLYLLADGVLGWEQPKQQGFDQYTSDPAKPVPFIGYIAQGIPREYMVGDQRFAARRPDVLVFQTAPLEEDLAIAGPVAPSLFVSTSGTDSDFVVKLIDVYPNDFPAIDPNPANIQMGGYQQLVRGKPFRAKYRNGFDKGEAMVPGEVASISYEMPGVSHVFRRGHRIMIQIQSSWFPLNDRNPQAFVDIPNAEQSDFQSAEQRVYRSPDHASRVELYVIPN
jgi:putative CocE/NonD family hydrolase